MNIGKMRNRVQLFGKIKTLNALNETVYIDSLIQTFWAEIIPQTGKLQSQQTETLLTNVTHKIVARYQKSIEDAYQNERIKSSLYIKFKGHRFDITFVLNPYFRNQSLEIFVEEVMG